jgi:hypothetical protein
MGILFDYCVVAIVLDNEQTGTYTRMLTACALRDGGLSK